MFLRYYLADKDDVVTVYPVKEFKFLITETLPTRAANKCSAVHFHFIPLEVEIKKISTRPDNCKQLSGFSNLM
jgi:hypothetical protein